MLGNVLKFSKKNKVRNAGTGVAFNYGIDLGWEDLLLEMQRSTAMSIQMEI